MLHEASWRLLSTQLPRRIGQMELTLERWRWIPRGLEAAGARCS
jgi:murein L,D-transpeptidase YcbB/YkuD